MPPAQSSTTSPGTSPRATVSLRSPLVNSDAVYVAGSFSSDGSGRRAATTTSHNRLVDRRMSFGQSLGNFQIEKRIRGDMRRHFYLMDWFHTLVNTRTYRIVFVVFVCYMLTFLLFAATYVIIADEESGCLRDLWKNVTIDKVDTGRKPGFPQRFMRATFFSMETMMTIGYGVDDAYFNECPIMLLCIFTQSLVGIFLSSILFGIVLTRVSRADQRARTVAFSDKAIVRAAAIDGELYLVMRVAEMR